MRHVAGLAVLTLAMGCVGAAGHCQVADGWRETYRRVLYGRCVGACTVDRRSIRAAHPGRPHTVCKPQGGYYTGLVHHLYTFSSRFVSIRHRDSILHVATKCGTPAGHWRGRKDMEAHVPLWSMRYTLVGLTLTLTLTLSLALTLTLHNQIPCQLYVRQYAPRLAAIAAISAVV